MGQTGETRIRNTSCPITLQLQKKKHKGTRERRKEKSENTSMEHRRTEK